MGVRTTSGWWPFLLLSMIVYGLLPRIVFWFQLDQAIRRDLKGLAFDDSRSQTLLRRLTAPALQWDASLSEPSVARDTAVALLTTPQAQSALLIRWRDLPYDLESIAAFFSDHYRIAIQPGQALSLQGRESDAEQLIKYFKSSKDQALLIVCDPWELPGEAIDRLRKALRQGLERKITLWFAPLALIENHLAIAGDRRAWLQSLRAFADPHVGLIEVRQS